MMTLETLEIEPIVSKPLPGSVIDFLEAADARIDSFRLEHRDSPASMFVPSDYPKVFHALDRLKDLGFDPGLLCEWGSGFGVVAALGSLLGHDAFGIEVDRRLVEESEQLLEDYRIDAAIFSGSYVPDEFEGDESLNDSDWLMVDPGASAYEEIGLDLRDFDLVYVFCWPGTEQIHFRMFDRFALPGSLLMSNHGMEGLLVQRKSGRACRAR